MAKFITFMGKNGNEMFLNPDHIFRAYIAHEDHAHKDDDLNEDTIFFNTYSKGDLVIEASFPDTAVARNDGSTLDDCHVMVIEKDTPAFDYILNELRVLSASSVRPKMPKDNASLI